MVDVSSIKQIDLTIHYGTCGRSKFSNLAKIKAQFMCFHFPAVFLIVLNQKPFKHKHATTFDIPKNR